MKLAICHPSPVIRRSLIEGLDNAGVESENPGVPLVNWLLSNAPAGAVLPLEHPSWIDIRDSEVDGPLIALIDDDGPRQYARAYAKQATGVVAISWEVDRIVRAITDAIEGFSMLPVTVAREMASSTQGPPTDLVLSATEAAALRLLGSGKTVVSIAESLAYSEREMHRILGSLYDRMGVTHRAEAIGRAAKWGLTDP